MDKHSIYINRAKSREVVKLEELRRQEKIKACIAIAIIILAIIISGIVILKYQIEGETNMPFTLSKIIVVSSAEGVQKEGAEEKWNLSILQNNDIYLSIEKNEDYKKESKIESISVENIQVLENPKAGQVKTYMPNSSDGRLFTFSEDTIISDQKLTFKGASKTNSKTLEIGNQGGNIAFCIANTEVGNYVSNNDEQINHDGTLIQKIGVQNEDISFKVSFDVVINVRNTSYYTNVILDLPSENNLIEQGTCSKEITDKFVFKRVNI